MSLCFSDLLFYASRIDVHHKSVDDRLALDMFGYAGAAVVSGRFSLSCGGGLEQVELNRGRRL